MKNYAEIKDGKVVNIIVSSNDFAEDGFIEYTDINPAFILGDYYENVFYPQQPYASWLRDGKGNWVAPVAIPDENKIYLWDEDLGEWHEAEAL
jgi:hypothetical protein